MTRIKAKYHIIYKTTCDITKRFYYGMHSTNNLNDGYLGSGSELSRSIKKYGKDNHSIEILEYLEDRKSLKKREAEILSETVLRDPMCMNLAKGGGGYDYGFGLITAKDKNGNMLAIHKDDPRFLSGELVGNQKGFVCTKDINDNIHFVEKTDSRYLSGELKWHLKDMIPVKDKNGNMLAIHKDDPRFISGELVGVSKGFVNVKDDKGNISQVPIDDPRYLSGELVHVWKDKKHKEESKEKIGKVNSEYQKGKGNSQYGTMWITNNIENKKINKNDTIPEGWRKGRLISQEQRKKTSVSNKGKGSGKKNSQYGTMWITNGVSSKRIKKNEKIPYGWYKGASYNNKYKK